MLSRTHRLICAVAGAFLMAGTVNAFAQGNPPGDQKQQNDPNRDEKRRLDEFAEAARVLGGPAANPECVWLGRRVVNLMWRDDLDTAFRHLDLYDRFGCPSGHIQATFRCLVRLGSIDARAVESLHARVQACWVNPSLQPASAAATPVPTAPAAPTNPQARAPGATNPQQ